MDSFSNFVEIQKLKKELSAKSGNLVRYVITHTANTEGQTLFSIDLSTFNFRTDSVLVQSGRTLLSPTLDYVVQSHSIVLNEGVPLGRTIDIYVYKNVENLDTEKTIDGKQIGVGTIPIDRIDGSVGGKIKMYTHTQTATEDGQTEFDILVDSFDKDEDAIKVYVGMLTLHRDVDFTISGLNKIVLNEGVSIGETITTDIFKQVEQTGEETMISGLMIEKGTLPLDRLAEPIKVDVTADVPMHLSVNEDGGVQIKYTGLLYETIEYIETDGTQYIDTGLKPNNNYRVVMDFQLTSVDGYACLFGNSDSASGNINSFALWHNGDTSFQYYYGKETFKSFPTTLGVTDEHSVDCNGAIATMDGNTVTHSVVAFAGAQNMYLFAVNYGGSANHFAKGKWKPCKIYDGTGKLVRDYIPVKTPIGVACMLDKVTGEFYYNKGTGEFIAGAEL